MSALFADGEVPISGEVQFWRMDPNHWEPALRSAQRIGITTIATYLSWRRHEPTPGSFDLRGAHGAELDVHAFLRTCRELGIRVVLKPGPWICAEEPNGGFPDWIVADTDMIALDHRGDPVSGYNPPFKHPMPSYSSRRFRDAVATWIGRVWEDLGEFCGPDGPVIGTQYDNEPSLGFQDSMYGFDWHPDALADWYHFLGHREMPPQPRSYGPTSATALERSWANWQRQYIADYLGWLRDVNHEAGAALLAGTINLNTHPVRGWPQDGPTLTRALPQVVVGEDHYYEPPLDAADLTGLAIAVAQARRSNSPLLWAPEMQAGIWRSPGELVEYSDPTPREQVAWWGAALALGYQGFNLYMLVDRENWEFAPIAADGTITPLGEGLRVLLAELRSVPELTAFRPVMEHVVHWDDETRINAYRVRGTQAHPVTAWDDPAARAAYKETEDAARWCIDVGLQFNLGAAATGNAPDFTALERARVSGSSPDHLVRLHEHADGRQLLYVIRLPNGSPSNAARLQADTSWIRLERGTDTVEVDSPTVVLPVTDDVVQIWRVTNDEP